MNKEQKQEVTEREIKVTPEMIRAGLDACEGWDWYTHDYNKLVPMVYRAMESRNKNKGV